MKVEDNHIMNILYSPVMYIHLDKLSELHASRDILDDAILNYWIFNHYELEHLPDNWQPDDAISMLLLNHWQMIPRVAQLIGGYLFREQLIMEKVSLINDLNLLAFISLPLRHNINVTQRNNHIDYSAWGAAFILGLAKNLPVALQQRLYLCFSNSILLPTTTIVKIPDHINLLRMAINYAYNS